jgi:nucleotide-binding universal stress UspA family protein
VCPIDLSDTSARAIDQAVAIAKWYHARISALYVDSPVVASVPRLDIARGLATMDEEPLGDLRIQVAAHCEAAARAGVGVDTLIEAGQPAHHILEVAADSRPT